MSKPKKIQYNGSSKVVTYVCSCVNWLLDNLSNVTANPQATATDTLTKVEIDGTVYNVSGSVQNISADHVSYDNTQSGLTADDVQSAIDEVVTDLSGKADNATSLSGYGITDAYTKTEVDTALTGKLDTSLKGSNNGIAELDSNGKVPSSQLPSYVDDVVEYASISSFPSVGVAGKIYVALDTNLTYRWSGSDYVEISPSLALGETYSTAYRGDRGKTAYDHSQTTSGNPHNVNKTDVGLGNVPNVATDDQTPTFTQASTRANIVSGEKLSVILGKIMKFFADLKTVAFSGSYNDLTDKPSIPSAQVNSDWNSTSGVSQILNKPNLSTVATSGSYNDLTNKPTIPTNAYQSTDTAETTFADDDKIPFYDTSASAKRNSTWANIKAKLKAYFDTLYIGSSSVGNGTLTIQKNGSNVQTFTANQSSNATANISVPTKTSDLTNDSGYITSDTTKVAKAGDTMTGDLYMGSSLIMKGTDINLNTVSPSSNDSGDIVWKYGNGREKARLWTEDAYTSPLGLNYRVYDSNGSKLFTGTIPLQDTTYSADNVTISKDNNNVFSKKMLVGGGSPSAGWIKVAVMDITAQYQFNGFNVMIRGEGRTDATAPYVHLISRIKQQNPLNGYNPSINLNAIEWAEYDINNCRLYLTENSSSLKRVELWVYNNAGYQTICCSVLDYVGNVSFPMTTGELPSSDYITPVHYGNVGSAINDSDGNEINTTYLKKSGGTMTGEIKTSYRGAVAMGSYATEKYTIPDFVNEVRFSSGASGSLGLITAYTKGDVTIAAGWYNYMYMPHRSGGLNGNANGDNCNYGSLLLSGMTVSGFYLIRVKSSSDYVAELRDLHPNGSVSSGNTKSVAGGTVYSYLQSFYITAGKRANTTLGTKATAEGNDNTSSGNYSHAEGSSCRATNENAHAEGYYTLASGEYSHAEGGFCQATALGSHAEGDYTYASGLYSHAEGSECEAMGICSHAEGKNTIAKGSEQHVSGKNNKRDDSNTYAVIVGNGSSTSSRSNAMTLDWSGNLKATSYSNFSSRKYKENIQDMSDEEALKLLQLNPVSYDYKSDYLPNNQFGLIAEDVEQIMTYPIVYENNEADSIDYSKFVPAIIKLCQIQQREIKELKNIIKNF